MRVAWIGTRHWLESAVTLKQVEAAVGLLYYSLEIWLRLRKGAWFRLLHALESMIAALKGEDEKYAPKRLTPPIIFLVKKNLISYSAARLSQASCPPLRQQRPAHPQSQRPSSLPWPPCRQSDSSDFAPASSLPRDRADCHYTGEPRRSFLACSCRARGSRGIRGGGRGMCGRSPKAGGRLMTAC